jgi:hypothetical protein
MTAIALQGIFLVRLGSLSSLLISSLNSYVIVELESGVVDLLLMLAAVASRATAFARVLFLQHYCMHVGAEVNY